MILNIDNWKEFKVSSVFTILNGKGITKEEIESELDPILYVGRSVSQVEEFIENEVKPVLDRLYTDEIKSELKV